jgi:hypothetical protein
VSSEGRIFLNSESNVNGSAKTTELAKQAGSVMIANLALLGYAKLQEISMLIGIAQSRSPRLIGADPL